MDLDRYLGLPVRDGAAGGDGDGDGDGDGANEDGEPRARLFETLRRRVFLLGTLVFAVVWFLVAKLRLLDAVSANVTLGAAAALLVTSLLLVAGAARARGRTAGPLADEAVALLRAGDVGAAIALAKRRLASEPSAGARADAESVLAACAALEQHVEEALFLAEMAVETAARAPFAAGTKRTVASRAAAVATLARGERLEGGDSPACGDAIAELVLARARERATIEP